MAVEEPGNETGGRGPGNETGNEPRDQNWGGAWE